MRKLSIAAIVLGVLLNIAGVVVLVIDVLDTIESATSGETTSAGADMGMVWPMVLLGGGFVVLFVGIFSLAASRVSGRGRVITSPGVPTGPSNLERAG